ncbi:unnamed protein product [Leuciscus chuanchicus]
MPKSSIEIRKINTLEEFEREEASLLDKNKFETLVCQLARVGGKDVKDCTHKVMDRLFTNHLMTLFNLKGKGKKEKIGLEDKKLFSAIKDEFSPESALERQYRELSENSSLKREREAVQEENRQLKEKLKKSKFQMYDLR